MAEAIILTNMAKKVVLKDLMATEKVCIKCGQKKNKDAFMRDHSCSDNRRNICRECEKERAAIARERRKERLDPNESFV